MISTWIDAISSEEKEIVLPLSQIDESKLDMARSSVVLKEGYLILSVVAHQDVHCPFEVSIRHDLERGEIRFNFLVGRADLALFEDGSTPEDRAGLRDDVQRFLRSPVRCVRERDAITQDVIRETFWLERMQIEGVPICLGWSGKNRAWFQRRTKEEFVYTPWVDQ